MRPTETIALRREPGHIIRSLVALLLRGGLGLIFLTAGLSKINDMTPAAETPPPVDAQPRAEEASESSEGSETATEPAARYPETIRAMFAETWLARDFKPVLDLHTALLPYVEFGLGLLLILGLFTTLSAFVSGLVLLSLTFGWTVLQNTTMYPNMMVYLLVNAGILWLSPLTSNYLSLDGLLFGWFWKPKDEGEYRREYEAPIR